MRSLTSAVGRRGEVWLGEGLTGGYARSIDQKVGRGSRGRGGITIIDVNGFNPAGGRLGMARRSAFLPEQIGGNDSRLASGKG